MNPFLRQLSFAVLTAAATAASSTPDTHAEQRVEITAARFASYSHISISRRGIARGPAS